MLLDLAYKAGLRKWLFAKSQDDPESAHEWAMRKLQKLNNRPGLMRFVRWMHTINSRYLKSNVFGHWFPNPVGLAAGFDKNCAALQALAALGFGFIEAGTVVPMPQPGNERPRIRRLVENEELLNRMGFNSEGQGKVQANLLRTGSLPIPLGLSLGKGKNTSNDEAANDYCLLLGELYQYGDYFVVNISSPNTLGLRELQHERYLSDLLRAVVQEARRIGGSEHKPILVKIAPDVTDAQLDTIVGICLQTDIAGVILANTKLEEHDEKIWGRSGPSLYPRALEMVKLVREQVGVLPFVIIGCGGINSVDRAWEMLDSGADLIQVFTALVYEGPGFPKRLVKGLEPCLRRAKQQSPLIWVP